MATRRREKKKKERRGHPPPDCVIFCPAKAHQATIYQSGYATPVSIVPSEGGKGEGQRTTSSPFLLLSRDEVHIIEVCVGFWPARKRGEKKKGGDGGEKPVHCLGFILGRDDFLDALFSAAAASRGGGREAGVPLQATAPPAGGFPRMCNARQ